MDNDVRKDARSVGSFSEMMRYKEKLEVVDFFRMQAISLIQKA
jgi:hypothetical protein